MCHRFQFTGKSGQGGQRSRESQAAEVLESPRAVFTGRTGRLIRPLRRLLAAGLASAACILLIGAGAASASTSGAQWSPVFPPQTWYGYFGNCTIKAGPVYDPYTSGGRFAVIGGGQIICSTVHNYRVTTLEYFSTTGVGASYYPQTGAATYSANNYGFSGILETGRLCGTGYWFTRVTVSATGYSPVYFDSYAHYVSATLC